MTPVYQLRRDTEHVRKVQKATLTTEQYGIEQTHGLFGSDDWWQKIESGDLPTQRLRGTISRVYMGSMGDWPCFEMRTDAGAVSSWTRFAHTRELSDLYAVGKRVEVDFVIQRNRQRAPVDAGEETECVIEVRIGDDARALQRTAAPLFSRTVRVICPRLLQPTGRFRRRSLSLVVRRRSRITDMRPAIDYSRDLRRRLAEGATLDQVFGELRARGASIFDCIVSVRSFQRCSIEDAKQQVQSSPVWSDHRDATAEFVSELTKTDDR